MGGTFDPIHNGHIAVAREVRSQLNLDEVLFIPAGQPWLKADIPISPAEHRLEMVRSAISDQYYCKLATIEIDRAGPTYTVDTMAELRNKLGVEDEQFFILGWDNLAQLPKWRDVPRLIELCRLVAVPRPGFALPDLDSLEAVIPGLSQSLIILDKPQVDIDATQIRQRVARGLSISHLVPEPVDKYIKRHGLYLKE